MKKIKNRAFAALLLSIFVVAGLGVYVARFLTDGSDWATFTANQTIYQNGVLKTGTVYDRNGVILAGYADGQRIYAQDPIVRAACLHAVGDMSGNIGTGVMTQFADELVGYNPVTGLTDSDGGELHITIDSALNAAAYNALGTRKGAVIICDYTTGEIICMTSSPSYDPLNVPDRSRRRP